MNLTAVDPAIRRCILQTLASGAVPTRLSVMQALDLEYLQVAMSYAALAAGHAIVLDPDTGEVWMAMPFSAVPTDVPVVAAGRALWANCSWDAFGIAAALDVDVSFVSPCPTSGVPIAAGVRRGVAFAAAGVVAHVAVPAPQWWDDIGYT